MPRTKGSKNRVTASADYDAQIAKLQKDKAMLEEGLSKTVAHIDAYIGAGATLVRSFSDTFTV